MTPLDGKLVAILGGSTAIYLALAVMMGVLPGIWLSRTPAGPGVAQLTPEQDAGRQVYVSEGCSYCHTQQIRPLSTDTVFGRPSAPGDFAYQTPELLGSERTGPDLTNIGVRQPSPVWQYMHLFEPRVGGADSRSCRPFPGCFVWSIRRPRARLLCQCPSPSRRTAASSSRLPARKRYLPISCR